MIRPRAGRSRHGPYKLVQATAQQKVFDLNPNYWGAKTGFKPLPKMQRVIFLPNQDDTLAIQRLINNEMDMCKIVPVPTLKSAFAQNPKVITFSGQDAPYGYTDWCPISLGFNNSAAPFDKPEMRQAINFAIDRTKLVNLAEAGAGVLAYHQFTPYAWFKPFDDAIQPSEQKYGLDASAHTDKVNELMGQLGYTKGGDGFWADASGDEAQYDRGRSRLVEKLRTAAGPAAARRGLRRQLRYVSRPGHAGANRRAGAVLQLPGSGRGEGHGPLLHAVDLYVAVLPPDGRAGPDFVGYVALSQSAVRHGRRPDQPAGGRRSQDAATTSRKPWTCGSRICRWSTCHS